MFKDFGFSFEDSHINWERQERDIWNISLFFFLMESYVRHTWGTCSQLEWEITCCFVCIFHIGIFATMFVSLNCHRLTEEPLLVIGQHIVVSFNGDNLRKPITSIRERNNSLPQMFNSSSSRIILTKIIRMALMGSRYNLITWTKLFMSEG